MDPDGIIKELPASWQRAAWAFILAITITVGYFFFVNGPVDAAHAIGLANKVHIEKVDSDVGSIQADISAIRLHDAQVDQKFSDMKDAVDSSNAKLDRLLMRGQRASQFP